MIQSTTNADADGDGDAYRKFCLSTLTDADTLIYYSGHSQTQSDISDLIPL